MALAQNMIMGSSIVCSVLLCYCVAFAACTKPAIDNINVPTFSYAGNRINITCHFTIGENRSLYSLKWYHNDVEFYRHFSEKTTTGDQLQFNVVETHLTSNEVTLELSGLTTDASGEYKCEVLDENPYFNTDYAAKNMTVIDEAPKPPIIKGLRDNYHRSDRAELTCHPEITRRATKQEYFLLWYINGVPASPKYLNAVKITEKNGFPSVKGLILNATIYELVNNGNSVPIECNLTVSLLGINMSKAALINVQPDNKFMATFFSNKDCCNTPLQVLIASMLAINTLICIGKN